MKSKVRKDCHNEGVLLHAKASVLISLFLCFSILGFSQRLYQISGVKAIRNGDTLLNPWVGGFNNPVISPIDLDQDGRMDLLIYDKAAWKASAFLNTGSSGQVSYTYAPQYDLIFPKELRDWVLVRDFNADGIPDLFALTQREGIAVYKGRRLGNSLSFDKIIDHLAYTFGVSGQDYIYTYAENMPVIADVDFDGDLDILAQDIGGSVIYYYQNRSIETGHGTDTLIYALGDQCWGSIYENSGCSVSFITCKTNQSSSPSVSHSQRDNGGAIFAFNYDHDHDIDLLLTDMSCTSVKFFENGGDSINPLITNTDSLFPVYDRPVKLPIYPAVYGADADNDGFEDLLISPFATNVNYIEKSEDVNCILFYRNQRLPLLNKFTYTGDTFLTKTTIDMGTESHPVFFDYNSDGLMDIVSGNYGRFQYGQAVSSLALWQNIGSDTMPAYKEVSADWSALTAFHLQGMYPAFGDLNGDGRPDMIIGDLTGKLHYFRNAGQDTASYPSMTATNWFGINIGTMAAPFIYDVNGDSLNDIVIGSIDGRLRYYWNFGSDTAPLFSPDSVNSFFGKVSVMDVPAWPIEYSSPFIMRDSSGLVLYSGSRQGAIVKYLINADSLRSGSFRLLSTDVIGINPGAHSTVSIADINHDGHSDYLVGNIRGGLMLFSDSYWGNGVVINSLETIAEDGQKLSVYPIPAADVLRCRLSANNRRLITAVIYDLVGQKMNVPMAIDSDGLVLDVSALSSGVYVLSATDNKGSSYQHKINVMK